jgi:hypothetical protein
MRFAPLSTLFQARDQQRNALLVSTQDIRELTEDELALFSGGCDDGCHHHHKHHCNNDWNKNWCDGWDDNWHHDWCNDWYC